MNTSAYTIEAGFLKALGHPKRLEIIHLLSHRQLTAGAIERMTGYPQANLSQHLRELKLAKIIIAERQGKNIRYRLTNPQFLTISKTLTSLSTPQKAKARGTTQTEFQDPVCGMWVEPAAAKWQSLYKGATYFFCASGCQHSFIHSPGRYV